MKWSLFDDNMILCVEKPTDSPERWLELANAYGKIAGYKIDTQNSVASLYTHNKLSKKRN